MTGHGDQDMCKTQQKLLVTVVTACQQKSRSMTSNKSHNMALASNNNFPLYFLEEIHQASEVKQSI